MAGLIAAFVPGEEGVADAGQVLATNFLGQFLGFVNVHLPQVGDVLCAGLVPALGGGVMVELERLAGGLQPSGQKHQRVAMLGAPLDGLHRHGGRDPDLRMGFLQRLGPRIDVTIVEVLAFPSPRAGLGPSFDDQVVGFLKALSVEVGRRVVGPTLAAAAANESETRRP